MDSVLAGGSPERDGGGGAGQGQGYSRSKDALTIDWISCIEAGEHLVIPAMNNHFLQAVFSKTYSRCKKAKFALADDIV